MIITMKKISLMGLCLHTNRAHCWHPSIFTALLAPYWFAEEHNCDMHLYITESHDVKYAGLITSAYAIDTISSYVFVFHRHHQSLYWRGILHRSNLYQWLWGNWIWCNTIDSRWGTKVIYNKDQNTNTYVSVWRLFLVGKIWQSHSSIKSRLDKP